MNTEHDALPLVAADQVEILVVMDNFVDLLLPGDERVERVSLAEGEQIPRDTLVAEHGLSLFISVRGGGQQASLLMDAGYSQLGVPHNLDRLGVDLSGVEAVVLSHGHMDHFGALPEVLRRVGRPVPLVVHPTAFAGPRYLIPPASPRLCFPGLERAALEAAGAQIVEAVEPYLAPSGLWAATGQVERTTSFEQGLPIAFREEGGELKPDPLEDDQGVVIHLKDKGLVVISGCAHAGIVNTVRHAQRITGVERVHAVLGGFHLGGILFEGIIEPTVEALKELSPQVVVPMHCSGRKATEAMAQAFPQAFVLSSVGSRLRL